MAVSLKSLLHPLWRKLPRSFRRRLFVRLTSLTAPRPRAGAARLPVVVAGVLRSATGLGESARLNLAGIRQADLPVAGLDLSGTLLGDVDLPGADAALSRPMSGPGSLILHVSGPFIPYALARCGPAVVTGKRVIGFWHWELPRLAPDWRIGARFVQEAWVPSQFCADAVAADFPGPVRIIPHPVSVDGIRKTPKSERPFGVLAMFNMASGFERKNPIAAIRAFRQAFGADPSARLIIKIANGHAYAPGLLALQREIGGQANITLLDSLMARSGVLELIAGADAVLSLHRSEGFGLLAAEAMLIGVPVIATDWSATTDFVTAETGYPIPYRLVPALDPQGHYHDPDQQWADPDIDSAAAALTRLRSDPLAAQKMAEGARLAADQRFSAQRYAQLIRAALNEPSTG